MSRAVVTHFDGDPFTINAWLQLYDKYWRGECNTIYATVYYNEKVIPDYVIKSIEAMFAKYPEIKPVIKALHQPPEVGNHDSLKIVTEDYVGLIESDGLIYGRGIVDQCFRLLENDDKDVVAPSWYLITDPYINGTLGSKGLMRCFCFIKKSILDKTDLDFMPRTIPAKTRITPDYVTGKDNALDCFGWISWQILNLTRKIVYTPNNILTPDNILCPYNNFKWVHIRQMSSSALGLGGGESVVWLSNDNGAILKQVMQVFDEDLPDGPAQFTIIKALAFKLLFLDIYGYKNAIIDFKEFADNYKQMLDAVIDLYNIPLHLVYQIKGFYKGLFNI